jgi:hypothetical protein
MNRHSTSHLVPLYAQYCCAFIAARPSRCESFCHTCHHDQLASLVIEDSIPQTCNPVGHYIQYIMTDYTTIYKSTLSNGLVFYANSFSSSCNSSADKSQLSSNCRVSSILASDGVTDLDCDLAEPWHTCLVGIVRIEPVNPIW